MSTIISCSIDLTKIDKSKIKEHSNGSKYYQMQVFINDKPDQYGNDVSVAENQTKEASKAKEKKVYIGNGKVVYTSAPNVPAPQKEAQPQNPDAKDDLPW